MEVTFLVRINLDDLSSLSDIADEISGDLSDSGFEVKFVAPWARPSLQQQGVLPMSQTTTQQQTTIEPTQQT